MKIRLSPETHRALRSRAAANGKTMEAEIRAILDDAVHRKPIRLGSMLGAIGRELDGIDMAVARDQAPPEPAQL